ncbi:MULTISPECIES: ferredoxin [unclassified Sphingobium]|uniref:ferredoxin n=1 Tax=unclassified Sphingobium TaxID=2611147 RepID=UPI0035A58C8C
MRIRIVPGRCTGHARCAAVAPQIYKLDDDGYIAMQETQVDAVDQALAQRGARACPERAIEIIED